MKISQSGIDLIKGFEGLRLTPYKCESRVWTIGYGHTGGVDQNTSPITEKEAEELLKKDLKYFEKCVNNKDYVPQSLNQNQFDALVSFAFNLGQGHLKELCNANYPPGKKTVDHIAQEITLYNKVRIGEKLVVSQILTNRREKEKNLFIKPVGNS